MNPYKLIGKCYCRTKAEAFELMEKFFDDTNGMGISVDGEYLFVTGLIDGRGARLTYRPRNGKLTMHYFRH